MKRSSSPVICRNDNCLRVCGGWSSRALVVSAGVVAATFTAVEAILLALAATKQDLKIPREIVVLAVVALSLLTVFHLMLLILVGAAGQSDPVPWWAVSSALCLAAFIFAVVTAMVRARKVDIISILSVAVQLIGYGALSIGAWDIWHAAKRRRALAEARALQSGSPAATTSLSAKRVIMVSKSSQTAIEARNETLEESLSKTTTLRDQNESSGPRQGSHQP